MTKRLKGFLAAGVALLAVLSLRAERQVYPVRDRMVLESLNGTWDFRFAGETDWRKCAVPGCWQTQGFARPSYSTDITAMTGEYRRVFAYNPAWKGRHVFIRFDGVMYGYSLSLNGRTVGEADSAYNLHQFDITEFLKAGENVLDVTVVTDNAFAGFDQCDDWSFGGIQRDVDIFTLGDAYIEDVAFRSRIDAADDADIELRVSLGAFGEFPEGARLNAFIADREWRHVADFTAEAKSGETVFRARLEQPALWTAETPVLHNLVVELAAGDGSVIQRSAECVGIREVRVDGKRILVNNRPVKLHGVCLNEIDPIVGRAFGYADFRRRMELMKRCHVNFIRTAHYPFAPVFYELAAEMGFYLADEIPIASGGRVILGEESTAPALIDRAARTVRRDKNCPAIVIWSVGNENPYTENTVGPVLDLVKKMDPTRPRLLPHPRELTQGGERLDWFLKATKGRTELFSGHYLGGEAIDRLLEKVTDRPIVQTEYGHAMGNGFDVFQPRTLQFWAHERLAGVSVWDWHDQGVRIDEEDMDYFRTNGHWPRVKAKPRLDAMPPEYQGVWIDPRHFVDSHGSHGSDGVVYANGYPKESWQLVRKLFSPVTVSESDGGVIVSNRFDFVSLAGWTLRWNGGEKPLSAPPRGSETVAAVPRAGDPFFKLSVVDPSGSCAYETAFRTAVAAPVPFRAVAAPDAAAFARRIMLKVGRKDGICSLSRRGIAESKITGAKQSVEAWEKISGNMLHRLHAWRPYLVAPEVCGMRRAADGSWAFSCKWRRGGNGEDADEFFKADFTAACENDGTWNVRYVLYAPEKSLAWFTEVGFAFDAGEAAARVDWDGLGPWTATADKDMHSVPGVWRLHKDDICFDGNRGDVRWAFASDGLRGVAVVPDGSGRVSFENVEGRVVMSVNVHVTGYGSKSGDGVGTAPLDGARFSGGFAFCVAEAKLPLPAVVADRPFSRCYGW